MDAKMRANFINSIAGGAKIPCPVCNTLNEAGSVFCGNCGGRLPAPVPAEEPVPEVPVSAPVIEEPVFVTEEPASAPAFETVKEEAPAFAAAAEAPAFAPAFETVKEEAPAFAAAAEAPAFAPAFETVKEEAPAFTAAPEAPAFAPAFGPAKEEAPAFAAASAVPAFVSAPAPVQPEPEEKPSPFALGLPEWSIVPPQMAVRRKKK